jgi:FkbM family methyltransferase
MPLKHLVEQFSKLQHHPVYQQHRARVLWRAGAWAVHCLLRIPGRPKFRRWNYRLYLPPRWSGGGCTSPYLFREQYEPELMLLERYLKPGMVFIDGGANTGVFAFTAARLVGSTGRVLAFEPGAMCFDALLRSQALNEWPYISVHQQALSDRCGKARLYHHLGQENAFSLGSDENTSFDEVAIISLDEVVKTERLARVDFIKLDVEGAEELVLRGAKEVLQQWRPVVLFEVNLDAIKLLHLQQDGACQLLKEYGYRLLQCDARGGLHAEIRMPQHVGNLLAVPEEKLEPDRAVMPTSIIENHSEQRELTTPFTT